eukprot:CAMPEP_0170249294 /NCGR_PEP_ID=MMETSP0116_2-20130129/24450_1 /TAXON_ID=400756 /ORGANISM="Durinskia baltica, Strain CSIRO CS-38" /LENGTH=114 /DNA_ID=CAMNT_0010500203 /DNA_START=28 /DNA_END=373 /DNA_ORIENTATION=-
MASPGDGREILRAEHSTVDALKGAPWAAEIVRTEHSPVDALKAAPLPPAASPAQAECEAIALFSRKYRMASPGDSPKVVRAEHSPVDALKGAPLQPAASPSAHAPSPRRPQVPL